MQKIQTLNQNVADLTQTLDFAIHNATKSSTLLQRQIFSQKMLETLINDLLDLAKLETVFDKHLRQRESLGVRRWGVNSMSRN